MQSPTPARKNKNVSVRQGIAEFAGVAAGLATPLSGMPQAPSSRLRSRVDLAGAWERHVHGKLVDVIPVPSSQHPLGFYHLQREFLLPALTVRQRAVVHFEAITYHGRVFVNGAELGTLGPYVPYEFDFAAHAQEGKNQIDVAIADLHPDPTGAGKDEIALGVNPGWEAYGGIIRDVYVEIRPAAFINNVRLGYKLNADYTQAACRAQVMVSSLTETSGNVELVLLRAGSEVARAQKKAPLASGASEVEMVFNVSSPALWSPEEPNLYQLRARLASEHGEDAWSCRTGFREVVTQGPDFLLNGQRLILNGVARHDMWKEQGFTLTRR